jgi:hypothetical protein
MIELRVFCRQLFHFGVPRTVVKIRLESWAEVLLRKHEELVHEPSSANPAVPSGDIRSKVEAILQNASRTKL